MKKILIDLFCKAGGATKGYQNKGFHVIGVDKEPQINYCGNEFIRADVFDYLEKENFDEIFGFHASPPCQKYSQSTLTWRSKGKKYPDLISKTRDMLDKINKPYVIENVPKSPLISPIILCGTMFGINTYRYRLFESNFFIKQPEHPKHLIKQIKMGRPVKDGDYIQIVGHFSGIKYAKKVMGIDWMVGHELAEAIPPCYTEYIGDFFNKL